MSLPHLSLLLLLLLLPQCLHCYDCYDQKCRGTGNYATTYITCDQEFNRCDSDPMVGGFPVCQEGPPGAGVYCRHSNFDCATDEDGIACCDYPSYTTDWVIIGPCLGGGVILVICAVCCCARMQKPVNHTFIIQPPAGAAETSQPWVLNTASAQPVLLHKPGDPGYGATGSSILGGGELPPGYPGKAEDSVEPPAYEPVSPTAPPHTEYNIYPSI